MKLAEIVNDLKLKVYTENKDFDVEVTQGYASDLLSDVMANAHIEGLWITLQTHQNIVAVAVLKSISAIILINNREPDDETIKKANDEGINILSSELPMFELVGKLYKMGISGS